MVAHLPECPRATRGQEAPCTCAPVFRVLRGGARAESEADSPPGVDCPSCGARVRVGLADLLHEVQEAMGPDSAYGEGYREALRYWSPRIVVLASGAGLALGFGGGLILGFGAGLALGFGLGVSW